MPGGNEIILLALLVIASATDLIWGKIYNSVTLSFLVLGLGSRFCWGGGAGVIESIFSVLIAFALFFPLWRFKVLAAGDVKLLMAAASFLAPKATCELAGVSIVIGALIGVSILLRQAGLRGSLASIHSHFQAAPSKSHRMPFGPAMLCAFLSIHLANHYGWSVL